MTKALSQLERQCGYKVTRHLLQVYGLCPDCQKGLTTS
jgi:Fe2+ or Zn2+ uptake regulation protein